MQGLVWQKHHTDDSSTSDDELRAEWNKSKSVFPDKVILLTSEDSCTRNVVVRVVHLPMTSNEVPKMSRPFEENGGIITFESMRYWIPTAAYALECARGLRRLYAELPQAMLAAEELDSE